MKSIIKKRIMESVAVKQELLESVDVMKNLEALATRMVECLKHGGKLILCGNGGSASDALHFAGEMVGRFQKERCPWPAVVLHADVASLTAISNDYSYEDCFAREAKAFTRPEDLLIGISTSGNSENVYRAIMVAREIGAATAAFLGKDGGRIKSCVDYPLVVPCNVTARVQESHITLIHILCELVENEMTRNE